MSSQNGTTDAPSWQAYAERGIPLFPVNGKRPYEAGGFHTASSDRTQLEAWAAQYPGCNWGMPTGQRSGFDVLDVDGAAGLASLEAYEAEHGPLPLTPTQVTGSGGRHYLFASASEVRNSAKGMMPGWDTRGDGGYIVLAPSLHPETLEPYRWLEGMSVFDVEPAPWSDDLLGLYRAQASKRATAEPGARIPLGVQESTLTRIAGAMRRQGSTEAEILAALKVSSDERCDPPVAEPDLARIARSISSYDAQSPLVTAECTDMGNAERFAYVAHGKAIYCAPLRKWFVWDGRRYGEDKTHRIDQLAEDTIRLTGIAAFNMPGGTGTTAEQQEVKETLQRWAMASQSAKRLSDMVSLARGKLAVLPEQLDIDPLKLCVLNGVIDLTTGQLLPHDPAFLMTKLAPVEYDPEASLPEFDAFLADTTAGKEGLLAFLQQALGYTITGDVREEKLFMPLGPSRTGKSTLIEAVKKALGDYAETANFHTFIRKHSESTASEDVARLAGKRFVSSIEVDDGKALAEALVKQMTGGDTIAARKLYQDTFAFTPTHKLWLVANHEPRVSQDDTAMWERILRLPFENVVPPDKRDPTLKARLTNPAYAGAAILAWLVKGALMWQAAGKLVVPAVVSRATAEYRDRMDPVTPFLEECCEMDADAKLPAGDLWSAYLGYCKTYRLKPLRQSDWVGKLKGHDIEPAKSNGQRFYRGVKLAVGDF